MIDLSEENIAYVILLKMDKKRPKQFYMLELENYNIYNQYSLYKEHPEIYSLEHWFSNKEDCKKLLKYLNEHLADYSIMDYYKFRFNLTTDFVKNNKRMLQKFVYSLSIQKD